MSHVLLQSKNISTIERLTSTEENQDFDMKLRERALCEYAGCVQQNESHKTLSRILSPHALYTFDAVWALLSALNQSKLVEVVPSSNNCFNHKLLHGDRLLQQLSQMKLVGISGMIDFRTGNRRKSLSTVSYGLYAMKYDANQSNYNYELISVWNGRSYSWNETFQNNKSWPHSSDNSPKDYPLMKSEFI